MGHIARKIEERRCIFTDGVVIIFEIHEKSVQVGKNTKSEKSDCHLNQIVSTARDGSASRVLNQFFDFIALLPYTSGVIYLNVKSDNERAKRFYERNGMILIDKTSWTDRDVEVDVYQKILKKMDIEDIEMDIESE
tara:strand:+ start:842 stop:1249 length:408 start_codon:yes stop_codon:yes gene_type:complete